MTNPKHAIRDLSEEDKRVALSKLMREEHYTTLKYTKDHMLRPKPLLGGMLLQKMQLEKKR